MTKNEEKALLVLVALFLKKVSKSPLEELPPPEELYVVEARDLYNEGWSMPEARGTIGALIERGFIDKTDEGTVLTNKPLEFIDRYFSDYGPPSFGPPV